MLVTRAAEPFDRAFIHSRVFLLSRQIQLPLFFKTTERGFPVHLKIIKRDLRGLKLDTPLHGIPEIPCGLPRQAQHQVKADVADPFRPDLRNRLKNIPRSMPPAQSLEDPFLKRLTAQTDAVYPGRAEGFEFRCFAVARVEFAGKFVSFFKSERGMDL